MTAAETVEWLKTKGITVEGWMVPLGSYIWTCIGCNEHLVRNDVKEGTYLRCPQCYKATFFPNHKRKRVLEGES